MSASGALATLSESIRDDMEMLVEQLVPKSPDPGSRALHDTVHAGLSGVLRCLVEGEPPSEDELEWARLTGRRQIQQNLPIEGVLSAYRNGGSFLWQELVRRAKATGTEMDATVLDGASELWQTCEILCDAAASAYREEEARLRNRDDRLQAAVLAAVLDGQAADPQFAHDATVALGIRVGEPLVCFAALRGTADQWLEPITEHLRRQGFRAIWTTSVGIDVGLIALGANTRDQLRSRVESMVLGQAGMSEEITQLVDVPRARRVAELAAQSNRRPGLRMVGDDLVASIVSEAPIVADELVARSVDVLLTATDGIALLSTLRTYLACDASINLAAERAFMHRNTLVYRLNKIDKVTGLNTRSVQDQAIWLLALRAWLERAGNEERLLQAPLDIRGQVEK